MCFTVFIVIFLVINFITFCSFGIDKWKAIRGRHRISERSLLLLSLFGGAFGALVAMYTFRHKTLHRKFTITVPIFALLWLVLLVYTAYRVLLA